MAEYSSDGRIYPKGLFGPFQDSRNRFHFWSFHTRPQETRLIITFISGYYRRETHQNILIEKWEVVDNNTLKINDSILLFVYNYEKYKNQILDELRYLG